MPVCCLTSRARRDDLLMMLVVESRHSLSDDRLLCDGCHAGSEWALRYLVGSCIAAHFLTLVRAQEIHRGALGFVLDECRWKDAMERRLQDGDLAFAKEIYGAGVRIPAGFPACTPGQFDCMVWATNMK